MEYYIIYIDSYYNYSNQIHLKDTYKLNGPFSSRKAAALYSRSMEHSEIRQFVKIISLPKLTEGLYAC